MIKYYEKQLNKFYQKIDEINEQIEHYTTQRQELRDEIAFLRDELDTMYLMREDTVL
jgi:uncharacterized coiled-coil DUF342 family protein